MITKLKSQFITQGKRGDLCIIEPARTKIPFTVKRVFTIQNVGSDVIRAKHAHHKVQEALFCIQGSCVVYTDDGHVKRNTLLNSPKRGLYLPPSAWRELKNFSRDCIVLVLANDVFDPKDYITKKPA